MVVCSSLLILFLDGYLFLDAYLAQDIKTGMHGGISLLVTSLRGRKSCKMLE